MSRERIRKGEGKRDPAFITYLLPVANGSFCSCSQCFNPGKLVFLRRAATGEVAVCPVCSTGPVGRGRAMGGLWMWRRGFFIWARLDVTAVISCLQNSEEEEGRSWKLLHKRNKRDHPPSLTYTADAIKLLESFAFLCPGLRVKLFPRVYPVCM